MTSRITLITAEIIRKYNGDLESPNARKNAASALYAPVIISPAYIIHMYAVTSLNTSSGEFIRCRIGLFAILNPIVIAIENAAIR